MTFTVINMIKLINNNDADNYDDVCDDRHAVGMMMMMTTMI